MAAWTPEKVWQDQDAHIIGGGASLQKFDFTRLKGKNTIGCNDAFRLGPDIVKVCLFGDITWWQKVKWELEKFQGMVVSCAPGLENIPVPGIKQIARERDGFHTGSTIGWNYSTGAAAINLAISFGANRVFLLGFDLDEVQGRTHWHKHRSRLTRQASFARFLRGFATLQRALKRGPRVEAYNVTTGVSKLMCFPRISFEEWERMTL